MRSVKRRAEIYRHGNRYLVLAVSFFENSPGSASTTIATVIGGDDEPSDQELGATVLGMIERSGVLDRSFLAPVRPHRSFEAEVLGLPSDAVLETETVSVAVTLRRERLIVEPSRTLGPGGGFDGGDLENITMPGDAAPAAVGSVVREATLASRAESAGVLAEAGTWKNRRAVPNFPGSGAVTARRTDDAWVIIARVGGRGGGETGSASTATWTIPAAVGPDDLGQAILDALRTAGEADLAHGSEPDDLGKHQVLVECETDQLTLYPQAIDPDTRQWDTPAHSDVRTVFPGATLHDIGTAVMLVSKESPEG